MEEETGNASNKIDSTNDSPLTAKKRKKSKENKPETAINQNVIIELQKQLNLLKAELNNLNEENVKLKKEIRSLTKNKNEVSNLKQIKKKKNTPNNQENRFEILNTVENNMEVENTPEEYNEIKNVSVAKNRSASEILQKMQSENKIRKEQQNLFKKVVANEVLPTKSRMPPINVFQQSARDTALLIQDKLNIEKFSIKNKANGGFALFTENLNDYLKIKDLLNTANTQYFSFTPKELKMRSLVLKGLDKDENEKDIIEYINNSHPNVMIENVSRMTTPRSRKENIRLPHLVIRFKNGQDLREVRQIRYINFQRVTWEDLQKTEIVIQCLNCQRFGHAAANCQMGYRCVKCSEKHAPGKCEITKTDNNDKVFCVLCQQIGHPASYRGCPKYKQMLNSIKSKTLANQEHKISTQKQFISNYVNKNTSFADTARNFSLKKSTPELSQTTNNVQENNASIQSSINILMNEFHLIKKQMQEYNEKTQFLMEAVKSFTHND